MLALTILHRRRQPLGGLRTLACVLAAAALGACAPAGRAAIAPSPVSNRVLVRNRSWDRVNVYVAHDGTTWRLGAIDALADGTFTIPPTLLVGIDDVYFVARPIAGQAFRSESFLFPSGTTAVWTIDTNTATSYVALRQ